MARITPGTVEALLNTASALERAQDYQWGHMGSCNCGFLARQLRQLNKAEIHRTAMQRCGNWTEQLHDYCPTSGFLMDNLITSILDAGFDIEDLQHLETLSNPDVLRSLPLDRRMLQYNVKRDVITYLRAWAELLVSRLDLPIALDLNYSVALDGPAVMVTP